jgi:hypothetical protein
VAREGVDDNNVLFEAADALHVDGGSDESGAGNDDILAVGEVGDTLPMDDDSGALHADDGSDVLSGGVDDDVTFLVIGTIGVGSSLSDGGILAAISGGGVNLGADVLHVGGDDSILGTSSRCSSGGNGALAARKGGGFLRVGDGVVPTVGGGILGTCSGGGSDHIVIHDVPTPETFTTTTPLLCAHKESRWCFALLHHHLTSDLTHHQRYKMLLSLSESGWGATC